MKDPFDRRRLEQVDADRSEDDAPVDALNKALDAGGIGTWRWIPAEHRLVWDEAMIRLFGLEP